MELSLGKKLFPSWSAATTLVTAHGVEAGQHLSAAIRATTGSERLNHAVRALTSFDHAIDNSRKLPVQWLAPGAGKYYRGYEAAKAAVDLLISTGIVPGARERVGLQNVLAARDTFLQGVNVARVDSSRFGRHLASGWLEATAEDALNGVRMLTPGAGRELLAGVALVQRQVRDGKGLDQQLVATVARTFDQVTRELEAAVAQAEARAGNAVTDGAAFARSGELLREAQAGVAALVAAAPTQADIDRHAVAAG